MECKHPTALAAWLNAINHANVALTARFKDIVNERVELQELELPFTAESSILKMDKESPIHCSVNL